MTAPSQTAHKKSDWALPQEVSLQNLEACYRQGTAVIKAKTQQRVVCSLQHVDIFKPSIVALLLAWLSVAQRYQSVLLFQGASPALHVLLESSPVYALLKKNLA